MLLGDSSERGDEPGEVLALLEGGDGQDERPAGELGDRGPGGGRVEGTAASGTTCTGASGNSSASTCAEACEVVCTAAPVATARRSTRPARATSACTLSGCCRNQQS